MKLDLHSIDLFENDEIDFDKSITFVFGKNGTGKSTITDELKKLEDSYDIYAFKGFSNLIDENKRLNAVTLGEENTSINKQIEAKKIEIELKSKEVQDIQKTLQAPEGKSTSNFMTRKKDAEDAYTAKKREIEEFYTQAAAKIKNLSGIRIAESSYDKRNFKNDITVATSLSHEEIKQYEETLKSEILNAPQIIMPHIDFQLLQSEVNEILKKHVIERVKLAQLENNSEKREFAKKGLEIHKKGDYCAFCGSIIKDNTYDELLNYFSADEVKSFQEEIINKTKEVDTIIETLNGISIKIENFYPAFRTDISDLNDNLELKRSEIISYLEKLKKALDEKSKYLFEERPALTETYSDSLSEIETLYEESRKRNNENNLSERKQEAAEKLRKHYVQAQLDAFSYDSKIAELHLLEANKNERTKEYDNEEAKITGKGGLAEYINSIQEEIAELQNQTINERILAENINKKLKHMVSFELVHVESEKSKGFYRVKNISTGLERDITELSTGEKNIIAFLYFIEKLDEVKETSINKPRIIVFDDPMSSNDDGMQYLIIEELQKLMERLLETDHFILLTHNKHFYLNVKYKHKSYSKNRFVRLESDGSKTHFTVLTKPEDDYKTSYESLWNELKFLYNTESVSADLLLNPIRRIIETFTKFNAINIGEFYDSVHGAKKLFDVNSHSIDDVEAELNGKTKMEIIKMFFDCFDKNNNAEHFKNLWSDLDINDVTES